MDERQRTVDDFGISRLLGHIRGSLERTFRELLEATPDAMVIVDQNGEIVLLNAQTERLFGWSREELLGGPVEVLIPARYTAHHRAHRASYFTDPRARPMGVGLELWGRRKDGSEFPVEISLGPLDTERGMLVMSAIRDVSERRRADERAQLLIRERAARSALEEALRARDEFLAVAAHELKTPVTGLAGFIELLLREMERTGAVDPQRLRQALGRIGEQSRKLSTLVTQLLDLSRIQGGQLRLEASPTDLVALARQAIAAAGGGATPRSIELEAPSALTAEVDPQRFGQVLTSLLDNALKYTPPDGHIEVSVASQDMHALVTVTDHGGGIAGGQRDRLFDEFYRVDPRAPVGGTGLALLVSRQIVAQHAGTLVAEVPSEGGMRLVVRVPIARGAPRTEAVTP
ncbi:MAG: PAS domain S-box protein [Chloroflexi bacterium]|nr:PAS domain S-box protein [Chloroflexota bacterium]